MPAYRLLLIEDDFDVAEMLLMYFQALQYEVLHADTGAAGIEIARTRFPNLILLDVMLPGASGYDICRDLRSDPALSEVRILMMTTRGSALEQRRGLDLGADGFIAKPFDPAELRGELRRLLSRRRPTPFSV